VRLVAGVCLAVLSVVAPGGQAVKPSERILSVASRAFVSFDTLVADIARADVVFLNEQAKTPDAHRLEMALLQALTGRRPEIVFAVDVVKRSAQEPLDHFQMGHLAESEFLAEAGIPPALAAASLPLMKFAVARTWPILATGPPDPGTEDQMSAAIVQAVTIGAAGGKRPLLVSLHASSSTGVSEKASGQVREQLPGRRVLTLRFVAVPSLESLAPSAGIPPNTDYLIYTAER
jgi:hypothetical protein